MKYLWWNKIFLPIDFKSIAPLHILWCSLCESIGTYQYIKIQNSRTKFPKFWSFRNPPSPTILFRPKFVIFFVNLIIFCLNLTSICSKFRWNRKLKPRLWPSAAMQCSVQLGSTLLARRRGRYTSQTESTQAVLHRWAKQSQSTKKQRRRASGELEMLHAVHHLVDIAVHRLLHIVAGAA